ncbi:alpha/beta hydrolase [Iamia sp. SCSIO 61187]|uniref:alpha/beta hydrolase n=1 Tax=Iamia sp. SCSIO 61187 TaxID=2722752 RepID=UPI001C625BF0|nr:alpha/beta fold hydrolase [Iamia sp. SCSIO 61187]QYG93879.1 alpha/beta hydrolase [Iamia sp. SCSIO 61187]
MGSFVLVHGAWHGGWCWDRVTTRLVGAGHTVIAPDLTGLGADAAALDRHVGLGTHVDDVTAVLEQAVEPVVLVGHSYAGFVVRQAADRRPEAVAQLVLLDAWFGADGQSLFDRAPAWFRDALSASAARDGDGWRLPPPPPSLVGVDDPADVAWVAPLLTDHPLRTFTDPTVLSGAVDAVPTRAITVAPESLPFRAWAAEAGWAVTTLATGHDAMVTAPDALAAALTDAA